jgi:hypothetical protein
MVGGAVSPAALTYATAVPLNAWTTTVKARVLRGTEWSALNEAVFYRSSPPPLIITEISSAPAPPTAAEAAAGFTDKDDFEFIEVMNTGSEPLNLRDIRFAQGVDFTFSDVTLTPGERAVVVHRLAAFRLRYGNGPRVAPDLSDVGVARPAAAIHGSIVDPSSRMMPINRPVRIVMKDGTTITGRRLNEDTYTVQLIDEKERLRSIETKAREASDQKTQETLEAIRTRHLRGLRFIQAKAIEVLKGGTLESAGEAARTFTAALKEERVIIGEPSDRTAVTVEDVIKREYARWMVIEEEEGDADVG